MQTHYVTANDPEEGWLPEGGNLTVVASGIPEEYSKHFISIALYEEPYYETLVQPTAGKIVVTASDGNGWGNVANGTIDFTDPTFLRPNIGGRIAAVKAECVGVQPDHDGAHEHYYIRLVVNSYK